MFVLTAVTRQRVTNKEQKSPLFVQLACNNLANKRIQFTMTPTSTHLSYLLFSFSRPRPRFRMSADGARSYSWLGARRMNTY